VSDAAESGTGTLTQVVDKVKGPALAGGAALAAVAGGVVLATRSGGKRKGVSLPSIGKKRRGIQMPQVSMPHVPKPHVSKPHLPNRSRSNGETTEALRATAKALGSAAVEIGKVGYKAGELVTEVRRVREQATRKSD
jgi:hypothetical protein